jgi:hypothetical protein
MVRLLAEDENSNVHELRQVSENDFFGALSLMGDFRRKALAPSAHNTSRRFMRSLYIPGGGAHDESSSNAVTSPGFPDGSRGTDGSE